MEKDSAENQAQETDRRVGVVEYGYDGAPVPYPGACAARVLGTWGDYYRIVCDAGEGTARKKASAFHGRPDAVVPTTGDFVALKWNPSGESRILATLPRRSKFERAAAGSEGRRSQTIAVNFDVLFFLTSANQNFNVRRIERFLSLGRSSGAPVAVLITKCDLVDAQTRDRLVSEATAHSGGAPVHAISVRTGFGLDNLSQYVQPRRTLAFIGSSGVGKSSLVNALAGDDLMPTLEVREWDSKGRHTTTERELVRLPCGALVIECARLECGRRRMEYRTPLPTSRRYSQDAGSPTAATTPNRAAPSRRPLPTAHSRPNAGRRTAASRPKARARKCAAPSRPTATASRHSPSNARRANARSRG